MDSRLEALDVPASGCVNLRPSRLPRGNESLCKHASRRYGEFGSLHGEPDV